jgi:2-oxoglutarate ferredoxin oxidoreductase subunit alpha
VSSFQLHFANYDIMTPGDRPDVLVAMNPAALKANIADLPRGGVIIADTADFTKRNLAKVGYAANPLDDDSLTDYQVHALDLTGMTVEAVKPFGLSRKDASRAKNMFALGLLSWLYHRPTEGTLTFLTRKFASKPDIRDANVAAFKTGYAFGETTEVFAVRYEVAPAPMPAGRYRQINGNLALALGLVTAARKADLPLFLGAYPITPASDVLHELSKHKRFGVTTFQAEDEIAGVGADQDRAVGPVAGDVRPQRRGSRARAGRAVAVGLLRHRHRGRADRGQVPHAGDAALRRLHRERRRAVAGA